MQQTTRRYSDLMFGYVSHPRKIARDVSQKCVPTQVLLLLLKLVQELSTLKPETKTHTSAAEKNHETSPFCKLAIIRSIGFRESLFLTASIGGEFWHTAAPPFALEAFEQQTPEGRELLSILAANAAQMCAESGQSHVVMSRRKFMLRFVGEFWRVVLVGWCWYPWYHLSNTSADYRWNTWLWSFSWEMLQLCH